MDRGANSRRWFPRGRGPELKIRAAVLSALGARRPYVETRPLEVTELELDSPGAGELLVRIEAAGICHSDLSVVDGSRPRPVPLALGHEAAGIVAAVGAGVRDVREGDHVVLTFVPSCGFCRDCTSSRPALCPAAAAANRDGSLLGGHRALRRNGLEVFHHLGVSAFAEYAVVARGSAVVVPERVPLETAVLFGCAVLTGAGAVLESAGVRAGQSVAVVGLGGVGLSSVMASVVAGAYPVIGVDPVPSKRALALELGAQAVFQPEDAEEGVRQLTGDGVQHAIETAGRVTALQTAYRLTARGGTTVSVGLPDPKDALVVPAASLVGEGRTVIGSYMGSTAPQRDIPRLLALWSAGRLPVERLRSGFLSLGEVNEALDALASSTAVRQIVRPHRGHEQVVSA